MISDHADYERIRLWVLEKSGISFPEKKTDMFRQRLSRVITTRRFSGLHELAERLLGGHDGHLQLEVLHAASTNHTYFFREPEVLDRFVDLIVPELERRGDIRIWSAASSTGDEAYSLAILIAEKLGREALRRVHLLGTDISDPVIRTAELGIYGQRAFDRTSPHLLSGYFKRLDEHRYQVADDVRACCTFRRMNLMANSYPFQRPFPVIFCRNVFYYFEVEDQVNVLKTLSRAAEPDGYLITSVTESVGNLGTPWKRLETGILRNAK